MTPIIENGRIKGVRVADVVHALGHLTREEVAAKYHLDAEDIEACIACACAALWQQE